ncbi:MAG: Ig-like domain-containing protein [Nitrospirota bacterium]
MKKRLIALPVMLLLLLVSCGGGGGSGSSSSPPDTNYGIVSDIQLLATRYVAQAGSYIYFKAKLLDGTGLPVANVSVTFTKTSSLGVLSSASAITDSLGYATVTLYSASAGFVTLQAEVSTGAGKVRDKKTVYFSSSELSYSYSLYLGADGNNNGTYNESADLNLSGSTNAQVLIRAMVLYGIDSNIAPVFGSTVTFGTDYPYFSSAGATACSDGTTVCYVTFPYGNTATTDTSGFATVLMQVNSSILKTLTTPLNVTAYADNGSANLLTLYLNPVTISSVSLTVSPTSVETDSTANAIAAVKTSTGSPAPDGAAVNFTAACPPLISIAQMNPPFVQTADGMATSVFNAPSSVGSCSITATSGGVSAIVYISVVSPPTTPVTEPVPDALAIVPGTISVVSNASTQTASFTISGGTLPYTTTSTDPSRVYNAATGTGVWTGSSITATIAANACPGTVTMNANDSKGNTDSATLTVLSASALSLTPTSANICETSANCGSTSYPTSVVFTITGGKSPYTVTSSNTAAISDPVVTAVAPFTFTADANNGGITSDTTVTLTITDSCGSTKTVAVFVKNE